MLRLGKTLKSAQVVAATPLNGGDRAGPTTLNCAGPVDTGTLKFPTTQRRYSQQLLRFSLVNSKIFNSQQNALIAAGLWKCPHAETAITPPDRETPDTVCNHGRTSLLVLSHNQIRTRALWSRDRGCCARISVQPGQGQTAR
jgi:hypothetical protein